LLLPEEKRILAYHECGHILISWLRSDLAKISKVNIQSNTFKASSFAHYIPTNKTLYTQEDLFALMCFYFGGHVAELLVFNTTTTNSEQDLKRVTQMAYEQIQQHGMSQNLSNMSFSIDDSIARPYSKKFKSLIDTEVNSLIKKAHRETHEVLSKNVKKLHMLSNELLQRETLNYDNIVKILRDDQRKF
jgi:ATP-dependent Zn protease